MVGLGVGMYGLTQLLTRVPIGIWSDAMGKRRGIVVVGMLVCGVAGAGLALSPSAVWLVVFRGVMGLAAATWVCSTVLFASYFPRTDPSVPLSIMSLLDRPGADRGDIVGRPLGRALRLDDALLGLDGSEPPCGAVPARSPGRHDGQAGDGFTGGSLADRPSAAAPARLRHRRHPLFRHLLDGVRVHDRLG